MTPINNSLAANEAKLREQFHHCSDIVFRSFKLHGETKLLLVYLDGMIRVQSIEEAILKPLLFNGLPQGIDRIQSLPEMLGREWLPFTDVKTVDSMEDLVNHILQGGLSVLVDGESTSLIVQIRDYETRNVQEPKKESTLRGSKELFL